METGLKIDYRGSQEGFQVKKYPYSDNGGGYCFE